MFQLTSCFPFFFIGPEAAVAPRPAEGPAPVEVAQPARSAAETFGQDRVAFSSTLRKPAGGQSDGIVSNNGGNIVSDGVGWTKLSAAPRGAAATVASGGGYVTGLGASA